MSLVQKIMSLVLYGDQSGKQVSYCVRVIDQQI